MTAFSPSIHQRSSSQEFFRASSFSSVDSGGEGSSGVRAIVASVIAPSKAPVRVLGGIASLLLGEKSSLLEEDQPLPAFSEEGREAYLADMDARLEQYKRDARRAAYTAQSEYSAHIVTGGFGGGDPGTPLFPEENEGVSPCSSKAPETQSTSIRGSSLALSSSSTSLGENKEEDDDSPVPSWREFEVAKKDRLRNQQRRPGSCSPALSLSSTPLSPLVMRGQQGVSPNIELDEHQAKHSPNYYLPACSSKGNKFAPEDSSIEALKKMVDELLQSEDLECFNRAPGLEESSQPSEIHVPISKKSDYFRYEAFRVIAAYSQAKNTWEFHFFPHKDYRAK